MADTEATKKFFELRNSGYRGPIDQDGNIPTDPDDPRLLDLPED